MALDPDGVVIFPAPRSGNTRRNQDDENDDDDASFEQDDDDADADAEEDDDVDTDDDNDDFDDGDMVADDDDSFEVDKYGRAKKNSSKRPSQKSKSTQTKSKSTQTSKKRRKAKGANWSDELTQVVDDFGAARGFTCMFNQNTRNELTTELEKKDMFVIFTCIQLLILYKSVVIGLQSWMSAMRIRRRSQRF